MQSLFRSRASPRPSQPSSSTPLPEDNCAKRPRLPPASHARKQPTDLQAQYRQAIADIDGRYMYCTPEEILQALLVDDVADIPDRHPLARERGPEGRASGELLACYLLSIKDNPKLVGGIEPWLQKMVMQYKGFPASHTCAVRALELMPVLRSALSHPHVPFSTDFEKKLSFALPPRVAGIGATAQSRSEIRALCMESLTTSRAFMGQMEASAAAAGASTTYTAKASGARGRILGAGQMRQANILVDAKIQTGLMREACSDDEEDNMDENARDVMHCRPGDDEAHEQPELPGKSNTGWQHDPPKEGEQLLGWNIKATFPTGPRRELRWHDGIIIDVQNTAGSGYRYQFYYPIDQEDEWIHGDKLPVNSICFRKAHLPGTCASKDEVQQARSILTAREMRECGSRSEEPGPSGNAATMRSRADFRG